ncbi:MAG: hypothetical protein H8E73_03215, partial [Planctomycetes bacterium]|nr:hypothetical protein [Planctomycetota bacterium]
MARTMMRSRLFIFSLSTWLPYGLGNKPARTAAPDNHSIPEHVSLCTTLTAHNSFDDDDDIDDDDEEEEEEEDEPILYIDEIARPNEPWYEIARKVVPLLILEPLRTYNIYDEVYCDRWPRLVECIEKHGHGLSLPEGITSHIDIIPAEIRHRLWIQHACEIFTVAQESDRFLNISPTVLLPPWSKVLDEFPDLGNIFLVLGLFLPFIVDAYEILSGSVYGPILIFRFRLGFESMDSFQYAHAIQLRLVMQGKGTALLQLFQKRL